MADYDLISSLLLEQKDIAADNPYLNFANSMPQIQASQNPRQNAIAQSLASFTQNFAKGYGRKQVKQEQQELAKGVAAALTSENPQEKLKEVSPTLASAYELQVAQAKQKQQELAQKMGMDLQKYQMQQDYSNELARSRMGEQFQYSAALKGIPSARQADVPWSNPAIPEILTNIQAEGIGSISPEQKQILNSLSPKEYARVLQANQQGGVASRADRGMDFKEGERNLPGFTNVTGATPSTTIVNQLRTKKEGSDQIVNLLEEMKKTGDSSGFMTLVGQDAAMQEMLQGALFNANRVRTNSGANFTETEQNMVKSSIPKTLAGDPVGAVKALMLGRDQKEFADAMIKFIKADRDVNMFSQGFKSNTRPLSFYPKEMRESYGLIDENGTPSPSSNQSQDVPKYKEQDLTKAGYSAADIQALKLQGVVE